MTLLTAMESQHHVSLSRQSFQSQFHWAQSQLCETWSTHLRHSTAAASHSRIYRHRYHLQLDSCSPRRACCPFDPCRSYLYSICHNRSSMRSRYTGTPVSQIQCLSLYLEIAALLHYPSTTLAAYHFLHIRCIRTSGDHYLCCDAVDDTITD